jgi:UDP-glucuronate 4-epimerase
MNVLVTGAAGCIGAHLCSALARAGVAVTAIDTFSDFVYDSTFKRQRVAALWPGLDICLREISIFDSSAVARLARNQKITHVAHLAAHANAAQSMAHPEEYQRVNVAGSVALASALAGLPVERLVFASSSTVYSDQQPPFGEEATDRDPLSPYGQSKLAGERLLRAWHEMNGVPVAVLRFFSVYGPWGRPDMAPAIFARQIMAGERLAITRQRSRDYVFIDDAVHALQAALDLSADWEVINIGSGKSTSLENLASLLAGHAGRDYSYDLQSPPQGDMATTYANISKAQRLLSYHPSTSIEVGTGALMKWAQDILPA